MLGRYTAGGHGSILKPAGHDCFLSTVSVCRLGQVRERIRGW